MNQVSEKSKKVLLIVRDGWGYSPETEYNMIAQAHTPYTDMLEKTYPTTLLHASGIEVGLPDGYFGNSEVGHMTMGAGRALEQSLLRINNSINDGHFFTNTVFLKAIEKVKSSGRTVHLIGLLQKEGVHSNFNHIVALLELAKKEGLSKNDVCIHVITDGRDAEMQNAIHYVADLETEIERIGVGSIVSLAGRYFAMDRDQHWKRTEKYYSAILGRYCEQTNVQRGNLDAISEKTESCHSEFMDDVDFPCKQKNHNHEESHSAQKTFSNPIALLKEKYQDSEFSDEFLEPLVHEDFSGIKNNDAIIFYNFRKDRARQLTHAFVDSDFSAFETHHENIHFVSMTEYYDGLENVAFPDIPREHILGQILEREHKTQLRISETEKYAHITFFFDGGEEYDFTGGRKILIPSPDVATFDMQPEMASAEITQTLISEMRTVGHDFILCNFPNADLVGHTGDYVAIKKGIEAIDQSLQEIVPVALAEGYVVILAADHGNAEYKHGMHETSHTNNLIPCTMVSDDSAYKNIQLESGLGLKNILASILAIMGIQKNEVHEKPLW